MLICMFRTTFETSFRNSGLIVGPDFLKFWENSIFVNNLGSVHGVNMSGPERADLYLD